MYIFDREKMLKLMKQKNISQINLARRLSVSHAAVGKWGKNGVKPTYPNFERLTGILDCSPNSLNTKL